MGEQFNSEAITLIVLNKTILKGYTYKINFLKDKRPYYKKKIKIKFSL